MPPLPSWELASLKVDASACEEFLALNPESLEILHVKKKGRPILCAELIKLL